MNDIYVSLNDPTVNHYHKGAYNVVSIYVDHFANFLFRQCKILEDICLFCITGEL